MKTILINAVPGTGKSTLLANLHMHNDSVLPAGYAFLDGDDLGRCSRQIDSEEWWTLVHDKFNA